MIACQSPHDNPPTIGVSPRASGRPDRFRRALALIARASQTHETGGKPVSSSGDGRSEQTNQDAAAQMLSWTRHVDQATGCRWHLAAAARTSVVACPCEFASGTDNIIHRVEVTPCQSRSKHLREG